MSRKIIASQPESISTDESQGGFTIIELGIVLAILSIVGAFGWYYFSAEDRRQDELDGYQLKSNFSPPKNLPLPENTSYAQKRKFADVTGDGVEDMIEVRDEDWVGQNFQATVFPGYVNKPGLLQFDSKNYKVALPLNTSWMSNKTKIDTADINGDGAEDVIFSAYDKGIFSDSYNIQIAYNNGDGTSFSFTSGVGVSQDISYLEMAQRIQDVIDALKGQYSAPEDINTVLQMDWADANGDGLDDFWIFWDDSHDLHTTILLAKKLTDPRKPFQFMPGSYQSHNPSFLYNRAISNLDTGDVNGDKLADLIVYKSSGDKVAISVAHNQFIGHTFNFTPQPDVIGADVDYDLMGLEKMDMVHANPTQDQRIDFVHVGETNDRKQMTYKLSFKVEVR